MKKIEAIIRKSKFDEVRKALHNADIDFLSWWEVKGQGTATQGLIFRGIAYDVAVLQIYLSEDLIKYFLALLVLMIYLRDIQFQSYCLSHFRECLQ